jgi:plastocyanin
MKPAKHFFFCAAILFFSGIAYLNVLAATRYTIEFGGIHGLAYVPNSLNVQVGDTIIWDGALTAQTFWNHPLESTMLPPNADSVAMDTGTVFMYVVKIAGVYHYQCHYHFASGMTGSFTASPSSVEAKDEIPLSAQNFPNPFRTNTVIRYSLINPSEVDLKVFDLSGNLIRHEAQGFQNSGIHEIDLDAGGFTSGSYIYSLQAGEAILQKRMIIVH